jgi:DNA-binding transcriptional ArsR family regulator
MPEAQTTGAERAALRRALGHPLRRRILDHLGRHGEANSTALAEALGTSTGTTSYHLRRLAELRLVAEVSRRARGRERWWRLHPDGPSADEPPDGRARVHRRTLRLSAGQVRAFLRDYHALLDRYAQHEPPDGARPVVALHLVCVPDEA